MFQKQLSQSMIVCLTVALCLGVTTAHAAFISLNPNDSNDFVTLGDLVSGQVEGVTVGDKTFSEFFYASLPGDDMPAAEDINVFGFMDEDGNFGVSFHGAFLDLPGGGSSDALLRFTVEVSEEAAARGYRISDAHLYLGGVGVDDNSVFTVDESFQRDDATLNTYATTLGGALESKLSDWEYFDRTYTRMRVTKDIFALAGEGSNLPARATVIDQSFSQTIIPEPATLSLVGFALLGIAGTRRNDG